MDDRQKTTFRSAYLLALSDTQKVNCKDSCKALISKKATELPKKQKRLVDECFEKHFAKTLGKYLEQEEQRKLVDNLEKIIGDRASLEKTARWLAIELDEIIQKASQTFTQAHKT